MPPSDELIGPLYLKGNKKGGLEASKLTPIAVWETYSEMLNSEICLSKLNKVHSDIVMLNFKEKDRLEKSRNQILSAEVKLRDSVINLDTLFYKEVKEYYRLWRKLNKDYKSASAMTKSQLSTFAKVEKKISELAKLKIGATSLENVGFDESTLSVLNDIKSFSETLNSINCPTLDNIRDTSQSCEVKVSPSSIGTLIDELESSINKISSHKDNYNESHMEAYNVTSLEDIKGLNEKYAFYTSTEGMRTIKFNDNYRSIFSGTFTNVNGPKFAEVMAEGLTVIQEFNSNIDKRLIESEKLNSELSAKFASINAKQEVTDKYNEAVNLWFKDPSSEMPDFISKLDQLKEYQTVLLSKATKFESQENLIQAKIKESKNIAALIEKLAIVYDSWWLNDTHKNADLATNFDQLITLQGKLINIIGDKDQTKSIAKELKKVDDAAVILQTFNR